MRKNNSAKSRINYDTIHHLILADTYNLSRLRTVCIGEASNAGLVELEKNTHYPNIEPTTLNEVLRAIIIVEQQNRYAADYGYPEDHDYDYDDE